MKNRWLLIMTLFGIIGLFVGQPLQAQFKDLKKKALKTVKENVKPLEIDFEVKKVKYDPFKKPNEVKITMAFNGYNPNSIGIKLARIEFDVYVDDKFTTKIYNDKKIEIPKKDKFSFEEKAKVKLSKVGKAVFKAIKNDKATYRIDGTYFVDSKFGEFKFKAELVEKEVGS